MHAVLPFLGLTLAELKAMTKKEVMKPGGVLGNHLHLIKKIAKKKEGNTLDDEDLSDKSEDQIRAKFVLANKSIKLETIKRELADKWKKVQGIYQSAAGKNIKRRFAEKMKLPEDNSESWDNGEEGGEDVVELMDE